jgi:hypothetical protein
MVEINPGDTSLTLCRRPEGLLAFLLLPWWRTPSGVPGTGVAHPFRCAECSFEGYLSGRGEFEGSRHAAPGTLPFNL